MKAPSRVSRFTVKGALPSFYFTLFSFFASLSTESSWCVSLLEIAHSEYLKENNLLKAKPPGGGGVRRDNARRDVERAEEQGGSGKLVRTRARADVRPTCRRASITAISWLEALPRLPLRP